MLTLSTILKVNAISSGATGIALLIFSRQAAGVFEVNATIPFIEVGTFLVLFAIFVFLVSNRDPLSRKAVIAIIALDILWVTGSVAAIIALSSVVSIVGSVLIAAVALWVGLMALLQKRGLHEISKYSSPAFPVNS